MPRIVHVHVVITVAASSNGCSLDPKVWRIDLEHLYSTGPDALLRDWYIYIYLPT